MSNTVDWGRIATSIILSAILSAGGAYVLLRTEQVDLKGDIRELSLELDRVQDDLADLETKPTPELFGVRFGHYQVKQENVIQEAESDGFVIARIWAAVESGERRGKLFGYTASEKEIVESEAKAALRAFATIHWKEGNNLIDYDSIVMPVRKGEYWNVIHDNAEARTRAEVLWIPLETQELTN